MSIERESLYRGVLAELEALAAAVESEYQSCATPEAVEELIGASAAGSLAWVPCLEHHVREALRLGVAERADNSPAMLSGGQQQRVAVARALANRASIILADEPTAALDSVRGRHVMELFRTVARQHGAGVIVVTHDHRALDVFDTIYAMEDGAIRPAA